MVPCLIEESVIATASGKIPPFLQFEAMLRQAGIHWISSPRVTVFVNIQTVGLWDLLLLEPSFRQFLHKQPRNVTANFWILCLRLYSLYHHHLVAQLAQTLSPLHPLESEAIFDLPSQRTKRPWFQAHENACQQCNGLLVL